MNFVGRSGTSVLFASGGTFAVVDEQSNIVLSVSSDPGSNYWDALGREASPTASELATAALTNLDIDVLSATERMHTIPKAVQAEAKRALEWRKENDRGGTSVGLNTARTLAAGGQIGIKKIRHIAKYFPRHTVDKQGKGYSPKEDGYPSNGRIAWGLWGGDAAQKWATAIADREDKKSASIVASAPSPLELFDKPVSDFMVRVRADGSGIDRLYSVAPDGSVSVWDDGCWDTMGNITNDFATYDKALDDPYDVVEKCHLPVDSETAIVLAALFDANPFSTHPVSEISPEIEDMYVSAIPELDFGLLDSIVAAGSKFETNKDGNYTPEERSQKATKQLRNAQGRFAETGSRVVIGGDTKTRGVITAQDAATKSVTVKLDNGKSVDVPANSTQKEDTFKDKTVPAVAAEEESDTPPLNVDGIFGLPKVPSVYAAKLPEEQEPLSPESVGLLLKDYSAWVIAQRSNKHTEDKAPKSKFPNAADDIHLKSWIERGATDSWYTDPNLSEKIKSGRGLVSAATPTGTAAYTNPSQSDVAPIYMAIVADDDPQAVMDLIALVPQNATTSAPMTFKRDPGKWVKDESILGDLKSPTPPPVIVLDTETLADVVEQIDGPAAMAASAGGRNADRLARYFTSGHGADRIRWKNSGSWERCVKMLSKHMGPRAGAYCALRHMEVNSYWPTEANNFAKSYSNIVSTESLPSVETIIEESILRARAEDAKSRVMTASGTAVVYPEGTRFHIPLALPEEVESGDRRIFKKGAITMRQLPLPLLWQMKTGDGHSGSVVVGKITEMERVEGGIGHAYGVFDKGAYGQEAERLVRGGFLKGVSADLDDFEAEQEEEDPNPENAESDVEIPDNDKIGAGRMVINKARIMAMTIVPKPAFQECYIEIPETEGVQEDDVIPDGVYIDEIDAEEASSLVACGIVAGVIPTNPPSDWFNNPALKAPTPLTVDDDGRVFGHIAAWHVDHIGMAFGTRPPRSRSKYAYFHTGVVRTMDGKDIPVGQLTLAGGHASLEMSAQQAVRHYDDTASAIADIHAGEDSYGIWVAGALRPGTTPEQIRSLRASAPSGDWRPIKGQLELVGVLQVNVPGFPIARARVASGQVMALVAAGANVLAHMKSDPISDLKARLDRIEKQPLVAAAAAAQARVMSVKAEEASARMRAAREAIQRDAEKAPVAKKERKVTQVDTEFNLRERIAIAEAMVAAGGLDRNRGNAEKLRRYWVYGAGAAKIRWGQGGDWRRCVRYLSKHMGVRAKGYCQLRHKDALGFYTGTHAKMDRAMSDSTDASEFQVEFEQFGAVFSDASEFATEVTEEDMATPIEEIMTELDDLYDEAWTPEAEILALLDEESDEVQEEPEGEYDETEEYDGSEEFSDETDILEGLDRNEIEALKQAKRDKFGPGLKVQEKGKYTAKTQPRDAEGKFRDVLARLKTNLGVAGLSKAVENVEEVENLDFSGDYTKAVKAGVSLIDIIDRLDSGALDKDAIGNIRASTTELGKVISNLPFDFTNQTEKIRFSDVPPALQALMKDMIDKVERKIGQKDANVATKELKTFMSGVEVYNQSEISSQMSKLLRLLT